MNENQLAEKLPDFFYGTAWKEEKTKELTRLALTSGFRAIDTANQRRHYFEEAVGAGIQSFLSENPSVKREDLFIQTKFTYERGQDHRLPYNPNASFTEQVHESHQSSLKHLQVSFIDSYVLHGPSSHYGLTPADWEVWQAMETLKKDHLVRHLGISNVGAEQLRELIQGAKIKPRFVQNRCFASEGWDKEVRRVCDEFQIAYQGFSLLTANFREIAVPLIQEIAKKYQKTIPQIIFKFSQQLRMIPLTGTTNPDHMKQDLEISDFELTKEECQRIERIAN